MSSPDTIIHRLEALKLWQEAEQQKMIEQQIAQRNLLISEQRRMFEALGLSFTNEDSSLQNSQTECDYQDELKSLSNTNQSSHNADSTFDSELGVASISDNNGSIAIPLTENERKTNGNSLYKDDLQKCTENDSLFNHLTVSTKLPKNKKPFLKRGSGLVKYRMSLEDCKLKNVPKYKFGKEQQELGLEPSKSLPISNTNSKTKSNTTKSNVKDSTTLYDSCRPIKPVAPKSLMKLDVKYTDCTKIVDIDRDKDDHKILESFKEQNIPNTWAQVLNNDESADKNLNDSVLELKLFELLEQKANNSSFCSTSSIVSNFLDNAHMIKSQNPKNRTIQPLPQMISKEIFTDIESDETKSVNVIDSECGTNSLHVRFNDNVQVQSESDSSESDESEMESYDDITSLTSSCTSTPNNKDSKLQEDSENTTKENSTLINETDNDTENKNDHPNAKFGAESFDKEITIKKPSKNVEKEQACETNFREKHLMIQQSALLKQRLEELEKEIEVFRKQNSALTKGMQDLELQKISFQRHTRQIEQQFSDEKLEHENYLAEEKQKLAEEKVIFEKYVSDLKKHPTRKEREEITMLKEKIIELQQEIKSKDAKYGAASARLRTKIRHLETDLANHQKTIDQLKDKNKKLLTANNQYRKATNKKMLQDIECSLMKVSENHMRKQDLSVKNVAKGKAIIYEENPKVINHETIYQEVEQTQYISENSSEEDEHSEIINNTVIKMLDKETMTENIVAIDERPHQPKNKLAYFETSHTNKDLQITSKILTESALINNSKNHHTVLCEPDTLFVDAINTRNHNNLYNDFYDMHVSKNVIDNPHITNMENVSVLSNKYQKQKEEILHPDGSKEIWYVNGNVKKISSDGQIIKMIYFNGDIKEIFKSNDSVKYFYAKNKTCHTTFSDGLEILEFPNGQIEKRFKNGTSEVQFPDGSIRSTKSHDSNILDEWKYPDGSLLINKKNGDKMLCMPNGQREIHTQEHRRREFPDGTVKLVYPDGSQETRYANGRIRVKDAAGNLIRDTQV